MLLAQFQLRSSGTKCPFFFSSPPQTPASSRTASFSENRAKVESSPAKKAKPGAPVGEIHFEKALLHLPQVAD